MDVSQLAEFSQRARDAGDDAWREEPLRKLASLQVPREVLGPKGWLLESDIRLTWIDWFIDSLVDRASFVHDDTLTYAHMYDTLQKQLKRTYPISDPDEVRGAAAVLSELAWEDIRRRRERRRQPVAQVARQELWFAAEPDPRCYLCGYKFKPQARDQILGRRTIEKPSEDAELPLLVDFTRPRGLVARDLRAEVDHIRPVWSGGTSSTENLRLACGWCNKVKSSFRSLYDSTARFAGTIRPERSRTISQPQPLWILRLVATRGRCEHLGGCGAGLSTNELFVAPRAQDGALNPVSAYVFCGQHDPWSTSRFVGRRLLLASRTASVAHSA